MTKAGGRSDPCYDLFEDWDLIVASFLTQYGLRIRTGEFKSVLWDEFRALLAGIAPETPLGRMVAIRSETDRDVIKHFTKEQKRIHNEWKNRKCAAMTPETYSQAMAALEKEIAWMCGGG